MGSSIVITFRECLEMLIIIIPLILYVGKIERKDLQKFIFIGMVIGFVSSIFSAAFLVNSINSLEGLAKEIFLGGTMIFIAMLILYNIIWMGKQSKNLSLDITSKFDVKLKGGSLLLLAAVTIFRESLEIIMFLLPTISEKFISSIIGIIIGLILALLIMGIIYKTSLNLSLNVIFTIITVFLIFMGGHLFGEGLMEFIPNNESIEMSGQLIYSIPLLFLFLKREFKKYMRKNINK
jgi:high-affinity iron transporter